MSEVHSRAQPSIQLEETMKASSNHSAKPGDDGGKTRSPREPPATLQTDIWGSPLTKSKRFRSSPRTHS